MKNLFILNLKKLLKNKTLIFWSLVFPLILTTIFYFVFQDVKNEDFFETITVYYDDTNFENHDKDFLINEMLKEAKYEKSIGNNKTKIISLFSLQPKIFDSNDLKKDKIPHLYKEKETGTFVIKASTHNLDTAILESFINDYSHAIKISLLLVTESNGLLSFEEALAIYLDGYENEYLKTSGNKKLDYIDNYFYTVIAMAIIYGAFLAFEQAKIYQPINYAYAKRIKVSGVNRSKLILSSILSALVVQFLIMAVFLLVALPVFGITFSNLGLAILVIILGIISMNILGFFFGIFFNSLTQGMANAVIILLGTLGGFFSGMMVSSVKFFVMTYAKPMAYTNINGLISNSFLQLDFGNYTNYWYNILALSIISLVLLGLTFYKYIKKEK